MTALKVCGEGWVGGRGVCVWRWENREIGEGIAKMSELDPDSCVEPEKGVTVTWQNCILERGQN